MATGLRENLPPGCHLGVTQDGRVFFINDTQKTTSWLHPVTREPMLTGLQHKPELPTGWERDVTNDGRVYYVDHNRRVTTFDHPLYGPSQPPISPTTLNSPGWNHDGTFKRGDVKQRSVKAPTAKRNPNSEVVKTGWLYRLETSGISKIWKRRWCVLADFALFVYKNDDEAVTLASILLPSYRINPCTQADNIKRNFVFKVEHENTKTLYFATDQIQDLEAWMAYLTQAAMMNGGTGFQREQNNNIRHFPANKLPQDTIHGHPHLPDPNRYPNIQQNQRPTSLEGPPSNQSPSYRRYGDPAASPLATPTDQNFPAGYNNPTYTSHPSTQPPWQGFPGHDGSNRNSLPNPLNRESHGYQPQSSVGYPDNTGSLRRDQRTHPYQPQQVLKDGFAADSARNSLAHSDSTQSGRLHPHPHARADMQQPGQQKHHPGSYTDPSRDGTVRDSNSDTSDNQVKQLNRWDQNFPSIGEEKLKHGSYDDLLDGRKGLPPGVTYNSRSKSHENFAQRPDPQQQPQEQKGPAGHYPQPATSSSFPKNVSHPSQSMGQIGPGVRPGPRDGHGNQRPDLSSHGDPVRSSTSSQSSYQRSPPHQGSSQRSPPHPPPRGDSHRQQQQQAPEGFRPRGFLSESFRQGPYQPGVIHSSNSSPASNRSPGNQSFSSNQRLPNQQYPTGSGSRQFDPNQQPPQGSLPRQQQHPSQHKRPDLQLSLTNQPQDQLSNQGQNSPHIYANLPSRLMQSQNSHNNSQTSLPARPPYPSAVRQQLVEEIAQTQTPSTQRDLITSSQMNMERMKQPTYFQYPSPRNQEVNQNSLERSSGQLWQHPKPSPRTQGPGHTSQPSQDDPQSLQDSFSRTNMMDPEARKLRYAYERVHSLRMAPDKAPPQRQPIQTVKEDPNMSDREVLETNLEKIAKKNPLSGPRLRMSISAGDLIGKTHDELVLLLIQLRRNQAGLEKARDIHRSQSEQKRPAEQEYRRQMHQYGKVQDRNLLEQHQMYAEAKAHMEEIENKLEVYKPIINLLDNMVTMGSLYGGDNLMLATQYRKHLLRPDQYQPPKKMLEFSRKHQEEKLIQKTEEEIRQLSSVEVHLEEKIDRLNELDRRLQEQSIQVSSLREDKELLERALNGVLRQQDMSRNDPQEMRRLTQQQQTLEKEISRFTQQLAEASKDLEETTAENSKLEYEVALLRNKVHGELPRSKSVPSLSSENMRTKMKMEKDLAKVEGMIQGLNKEGARLSQAMSTIRRSSSSSNLASALDKVDNKKKGGTYLQTDLDSGEQVDLAGMRERAPAHGHNSKPAINLPRQNASASEEWNVENADENTKQFFGLVPKEKPKSLTVRDVKRQAEQRKERDKGQKDHDDYGNGEDIKLQVSDVDTEATSILHARLPSHASSKPPGQWEAGHPLYENLRYQAPTLPETTHSAPGSRRSSLVLMAPKPFTPYQDRTARPFRSELELSSASQPQANDHTSGSRYPLTTTLDRLNRTAEILKSPPSDKNQTGNIYPEDNPYVTLSLTGTQVQVNPYVNDYPINSFASQNKLAPGQLEAKPLSLHTRSQSDISGNVGDTLKPSQVREIFEQQTSDSNSWQTQDTDPPASAYHITRPISFTSYQPSRAYTAKPWTKQDMEIGVDLFNLKRSPKGRYPTISSSEPLRLERNILLSQTLHSTAGDLILSRPIDDVPDIIKSSQSKVDQIDEKTIDREILFVPEKVFIPERYDPEADAEQLTEEEKLRRREKAEKIKRLLASQSVLSMSQTDIAHMEDQNFHSLVQQEQMERTHYLTLNQELARQVTLQSKKQAAERRKTWSGAQFAIAKRQYEQELMG